MKRDDNMHMPKRFMDMILDMHYAWSENGKVWFVSERLNYLCCADVEKKEISAVCKLPCILAKGWCEYIQVIKYQNKLILLPCVAHNILIYDIESCVLKTIPIMEYTDNNKVWCKSAGIIKNKLYIIEQLSKQIIVLNLGEEIVSEVLQIKYIDEEDTIGGQSTIYQDRMYIPIVSKEKVVSFDISTCIFEEHFIIGEMSGCGAICHDSEYCWLIGGQYGIVRWSPLMGDVSEVRGMPEEFKIYAIDNAGKELYWYSYVENRKLYDLYDSFFCYENFYDGKYIWIIPEKSDSIVRVNACTMQADIVQLRPEFQKEDYGYKGRSYEFSTWGIDRNKKLRVISRYDFRIYCIDIEDLSYQVEEWAVSRETMEILVNSLWDQKVLEGRWFNVNDLVYSETSGFLKFKDVRYQDGVGANIHKFMFH